MTSKGTIVHITSDFLPNAGGVASVVHNLALVACEEGFDVHVVYIGPAEAHAIYSDLPYKVHCLPYKSIPTKPLRYVKTANSIRRILKSLGEKATVHCHTHLPETLCASISVPKRRLFLTVHTSGFLDTFETLKYSILYRLAQYQCKVIFCPSTEIVEAVIKVGSAKQVEFISNGIRSQEWNPVTLDEKRALKERKGFNEHEKVIFAPRRVVYKNGIDVLVEAFAMLCKTNTSAILVLCCEENESTYGNEIIASAKKLIDGKQFRFIGSQSHTMMKEWQALADLCVIPSRQEATSVACLEAMSLAKPIIVSNVGGLPELIQHKMTGLIVPPCDTVALADAMKELLNDDGNAERLGNQARVDAINRFDWINIFNQYKTFYEDR